MNGAAGSGATGATGGTGSSSTAKTPVSLSTILSGLSASQIISIVGLIAGAVAPPGTEVAGFTIAQLIALATGVANELPAAVQTIQEIEQLAASGVPPTAAQWASWNAAADQANAALNAAADAIEAGAGP